MAAVGNLTPLSCFCSTEFRPAFFAMTPLNDCKRCGGMGWVEEHVFTGYNDKECTRCGWSRRAHWKKED